MNFLSIFRPSIIGSSQLNGIYRSCTRSSSSVTKPPPTAEKPPPKEDAKIKRNVSFIQTLKTNLNRKIASGPSQTPTPRSSCPADTILTGVNYLKGQLPTVAQPDEAYPEWLWSTLKAKELEDDGPGGQKERAERRKANRQAIRDRNFMQTQ